MIWWLAVPAALAFWLLAVRIFPYKRCYGCKGRKGKRYRRVHSHCWRCNAKGELRRIGARWANRVVWRREI